MSGFDLSETILAGWTDAECQAAFQAAKTAYTQLLTGAKVVTASYAQAEGSQTVSYTRAELQQLTAFIRLLQTRLGILTVPRRPILPNFR